MSEGKIALLYTTCNDFNPQACASLLEQTVRADLFILDDSDEVKVKQEIKNWAVTKPNRVTIVEREGRIGFKGGNINHWLTYNLHSQLYDYVLIVDADEVLPPGFTEQLLSYMSDDSLTFVQACHLGTSRLDTVFQRTLHPLAECIWLHQVPTHNIAGIVPVLGHGVLIRTQALYSVGGFPDLVSEDLAISITLADRGYKGIIATDVIGYEEFPRTYRAYWQRLRRWIRADAEVVRKLLPRLWASQTPISGRVDISLREFRLTTGFLYWLLLTLVALSDLDNTV